MDSKHKKYLQAMDIQLWEEKNLEPAQSEKETSPCESCEPSVDWKTLEKKVLNCTLCDLSQSRTKVVFGTGSCQADLLIIGEAPGASEDAQGKPFVGRAGMLLTSILKAIGFNREDVYITNILKCRPPQNRDPFPREIDCCTPYLKEQIALLNPRLMVAVGRVAAQFLLKTTETLGKLRGRQHQYGDIPLVITYHPAYLLRSPREKAKAYDDWGWIKQLMEKL